MPNLAFEEDYDKNDLRKSLFDSIPNMLGNSKPKTAFFDPPLWVLILKNLIAIENII
jgi:hypothetical protein